MACLAAGLWLPFHRLAGAPLRGKWLRALIRLVPLFILITQSGRFADVSPASATEMTFRFLNIAVLAGAFPAILNHTLRSDETSSAAG